MNEIIKQALSVYGPLHQMDMATEEMAELIQALNKYKRYHDNEENIAEEIADVEITLEYLKIIFNNEELIEEYKVEKLKRLEKRLEHGSTKSKEEEKEITTESTTSKDTI